MFKVFYRYGQKYIAVLLLFRDDVKKLFHTTTPVTLSNKSINIIAIIRMRNESLLLNDTLNHLAKIVDGIVIYDDMSTDESVAIAERHDAVLHVIRGKRWLSNRVYEETHHRQVLLDYVQRYNPEWIFSVDCDERFDGNIRSFLLSSTSAEADGVKIRLFDAYMTKSDALPYESGKELYNFRRLFGPEYRDILMLWRNNPQVKFRGVDSREPTVRGRVVTKFFCQHYGKSLSSQHWKETCKYYVDNFPEPYISKWQERVGKAIHYESDFGRALYNWDDVKNCGIELNK